MIEQEASQVEQEYEMSYRRVMMAIDAGVQSEFITIRREDMERFAAMLNSMCDAPEAGGNGLN